MASSEKWLGNVSDLMSGLMLVFLFIAIIYMMKVEEKAENLEEEKIKAEKLAENYKKQGETIREITATYEGLQKGLYQDLLTEFKKDLIIWDATLEEDSTIRFNEPEILFETGQSDLKPLFTNILDDFFPRYLKILTSSKYNEQIAELRIEGHTSSQWGNASDRKSRYLYNAKLSQERAYQVMKHCFNLSSDNSRVDREWLIKYLRANGLSFSNPILSNGHEDASRSRRVEFRVVTKSEEKILRILEVQDTQNAN